jgi:hypothetical protein
MVLAVALASTSCGDATTSSEESTPVEGAPAPEAVTEATKLSDADVLRACRAGQSFQTGQPVNTITARNTGEQLARLSYDRDDGKHFEYDCRVEGNVLRFRMIDEAGPGSGPGAWSGRGTRTTFELSPDAIELSDDFFDGSTDHERIEI